MRIIHLNVDDTLFKMMRTDKYKHGFESWEAYVEYLFAVNKETKKFLRKKK